MQEGNKWKMMGPIGLIGPIRPMKSLNPFEKIQALLQGPPRWARTPERQPSALAYLLAQVFPRLKRTLVAIAPTGSEAETLLADLRFFLGEKFPIVFFPNLDVLPYFQLSPHPEILTQRLGALYELSSARGPLLLITSYSAFLRRLPPR